MKYDDISPLLREFLGAREGFRKLGFPADDLYITISRSALHNGVLSCFCTLMQGGKVFHVECGPVPSDDVEGKALGEEYTKVANAINNNELSQEDADRLWNDSTLKKKGHDFVVALLNKGFKPPKKAN